MCTITFVPTSDLEFQLAHNRDETIYRMPATKPSWQIIDNKKILAPIDPLKGGTWIWTSKVETVFLFNGAFEKHKPKESYNRSRGQIALEVLQYQDYRTFCDQVNLQNVEPFTIVHIPHTKGASLSQLVWDENQKHIFRLDRTNQIWSSVTLYDSQTIEKKKSHFVDWSKTNLGLMDFMRDRDLDPPIYLDQFPIQTVSTTLVTLKNEIPTMAYFEYADSLHN